jgi:antitoxin component YwqK of YwqJK toxin-antitoxin module
VWHITGARAEEGVYEGGVKQGEWAFYHVEGNKLEQGIMINDQKEGVWREWLHTGTFWREVTYVNGRREGADEEACEAAGGVWEVDYKERIDRCSRDGAPIIVERHYDESGALRRRVPYTLEGINQGKEQRFHPTGELLAEFEVLRGVPEGVYSFKSPTGELYGEHVITRGTGPWRSYHPNGALEEEGQYQQGIKTGRWRTFYDHAQPQGLSPAGEGEVERPVGLKDELTFSDQGMPEGAYLSLYEDGTLSVTGAFSGGSRTGPWRFHYQNGQVAIEAHYNMGMRSGPWREWHWLASPKVKGQHLINRKDGVWEEYHNNGKLKAKGRYLKGKKEGPWALFWYSGEPWRTVMYEGGVAREEEPLACEMISGAWSEDLEARRAGCHICRVSAEGAPKKLKVGRWRWWHPNGALEGEGDYEGGEPHGLWRQFNEEGRLTLEGRYEHGERVTLWRGFFSNGALQYEGRFEPLKEGEPPQKADQTEQAKDHPSAQHTQEEPSKGREEGVWYTFHANGSLESAGRYEGGRRVGVWAWWHESGALSQVGAYQEGVREGVWVSWHVEGGLRDLGAYVKGARRGVWRWWRETGEAWRAQWYGEGRARLSLPKPPALSVLSEQGEGSKALETLEALEALKRAVNASLPQRSAEALKGVKERVAPRWEAPPQLLEVSERIKALLRSSGLEEAQPSSPSERVR